MFPSHSGPLVRFGGEHRVSELKLMALDVLIGWCESLAAWWLSWLSQMFVCILLHFYELSFTMCILYITLLLY